MLSSSSSHHDSLKVTTPVDTQDAWQAYQTPRHPLQCRYAGKKCRNVRATKRNGSLHTLCDHHRIRANQNQRRMSQRARMRQVHAESVLVARTYSARSQSSTLCEARSSSMLDLPQWEQFLEASASEPPSPPQELLWKDYNASNSAFGTPVLHDEYSLQELLSNVPRHIASQVWSDHEVVMAMRAAFSEAQASGEKCFGRM